MSNRRAIFAGTLLFLSMKLLAVNVDMGVSSSNSTAQTYVIKACNDWIPLDYYRDIEPGSALDFSSMGFTDAPAGKYGWLKNVNGHFEFENRPGHPQRFCGVNLCYSANFPDHYLAEVLVNRFKRLGYNAIRIHHQDIGTVKGSKDGLTLNMDFMDRLDFLVATIVRQGLYLTTDLYVSRGDVIRWRDIGIDRDGVVGMQLMKALCAVYDPAFDNWATYAKNFLLHENKYTGRRYIDEPALPLISLVNEGAFLMGWDSGIRKDPRFLSSWKKWLAAKRSSNPQFAEGVNDDAIPEKYWDKRTTLVVQEWAGELEAKMVARMKAYLRDLGCKALVSNDNCGPHYAVRNGLSQDYDYVDDHFYVDHPRFLKRSWRLPSFCPNRNPLVGDKPIVPIDRGVPIIKGKPFVVTEWNFSGPGRYRGMGGILTGATAAIQDWDGLWRFAYAHSCEGLGNKDDRRPGYFDLASDPLAQAAERASICLFLRGDIEPDEKSSISIDRKQGAFLIDSKRTIGGFVSSGRIEVGVLSANVVGAPATVWVSSLDGAEISNSQRIVFTHLTDVQGEGIEFADDTMTTLLKWGTRPLVRNGTVDVLLKLNHPSHYNVYELSTSGKRVRQIFSCVQNDDLYFKASVSGPDGARFLYEVVSEKLSKEHVQASYHVR